MNLEDAFGDIEPIAAGCMAVDPFAGGLRDRFGQGLWENNCYNGCTVSGDRHGGPLPHER